MASNMLAAPRAASVRRKHVTAHQDSARRSIMRPEPQISVSMPVWALPHVVRFVRFLAQERKSGPGLTRTLLDGQ
jgi:hypothetical protein